MLLDELNLRQREAVLAPSPLLIIAGAGSGKTKTLAHRVARLVQEGADPQRLLLLTFSRRAALEMTTRAARLLGKTLPSAATLTWAGTFHAVANRLLLLHARELALDPAFTVLDRSDACGLVDLERHRLGLDAQKKRFPRKGTCLAIYSRAVNACEPLKLSLEGWFPHFSEHEAELKRLFAAYEEAKQRHHVLDYDDLLSALALAVSDENVAARIARRFDHVLVDEYQDTNALQAELLYKLQPDGRGLTVVGDDAQSIYAFRAAEVRNILDFPARFPSATRVTLEENYRSTQPILEAANRVIALAPKEARFAKELRARRVSVEKPYLVAAEDERAQADYVVTRVLHAREAGVPLKRQAVLFRAAHHADVLEVELQRRDIPFVKYGGLKFLEAAHVKDALCVLRLCENLRDEIAIARVVQLLPGVGPQVAARAARHLEEEGFQPDALGRFRPPRAAEADWPPLCALVEELAEPQRPWPGQLGRVRRWYEPHLERIYDHARVRAQDLEQLEAMAASFASRERFLSELTLDPPQATGDHAGDPLVDEDYLILSTIHSAKGQEWDAVFLLNACDGNLPADLATATPAQIEEERRLLYVAMTRARDQLHVIHPLRFYLTHQRRFGDLHVYAPRTRFIPDALLPCFQRVTHGTAVGLGGAVAEQATARVDVAARLRQRWS